MATVLAFHAHPDDEVVLTGGTLARLAAEGHRVVLVVATDGFMGEPPEFTDESTVRLDEVQASAAVLGVHRVEHLGYADSGHGPIFYPDPPTRTRFARADTEEAAARLTDILREERADVLLSYEANGGYGHRDHLKVHEVGKRAAELAGTSRVLEVTMPRELLMRGLAITRRLRLPFLYAASRCLDCNCRPRCSGRWPAASGSSRRAPAERPGSSSRPARQPRLHNPTTASHRRRRGRSNG
jgi:LmbE family N-acetylglucosaminyl deacetylase